MNTNNNSVVLDEVLQYDEEEHIQMTPPAKVRVTFYESRKPHFIATPDSSEFSYDLQTLSLTMATEQDVQKYISMNVGADNPFRPGGELSCEVQSLVRQVQTGQPLASSTSIEEIIIKNAAAPGNMATPPGNMATSKSATNSIQGSPSTPPTSVVEIQHGIVVPPASPSNVERVMLKKKPKCHCCVIL